MKIFIIILITLNCYFYNNLFSQWEFWEKTNGPNGGQINTIVLKNDTIFAGGVGGVFISTDNGLTWSERNSGMDLTVVYSLFTDGTYLYAGKQSGVYRTTDNGQQWSKISNGLSTNIQVYSIIKVNANLFIGTNNGIYMSTNNGDSWIEKNNGISSNRIVKIVNIDNNIFAMTNENIYYSANNGDAWQITSINYPEGSIDYIETHRGKLYGLFSGNGICFSEDYGNSWTLLTDTLGYNVYSLIYFKDDYIFVGTHYYGLFKSSDNGQTWNSANNGSEILRIQALAFANNKLFAASIHGAGIYYSTNFGDSWGIENTGLTASMLQDFDLSDNVLYTANMYSGVHKTTDQGTSWTQYINGVGVSQIANAILVKNDTLYAGTLFAGVIKSTDGGLSWIRYNQGLASYIHGLLEINDHIFAATELSGVYLTTNDGISWSFSGIDSLHVNSLYNVNDDIIACTVEGIYKSEDLGNTWNELGLSDKNVIAFTDNNDYYFSGTNQGLFISNDSGKTWTKNFNNFDSKGITSLYSLDSIILAGTASNGIFLSVDNGYKWRNINLNLDRRKINDFIHLSDTLFIGTFGVYKINIDNLLSMLDSVGTEIADTVCIGDLYTFSVSTKDKSDNLYQWFKNNAAVTNISNDSSYTIENVTNDDSGDYYCHITNPKAGDFKIYSKFIHLYTYPELLINAGNDKIITQWKDSVTLGGIPTISNGEAPFIVKWEPHKGLESDTLLNPKAFPFEPTEYILTITDKNGCITYDTIFIDVDIPEPQAQISFKDTIFSLCDDIQYDTVQIKNIGGWPLIINNAIISGSEANKFSFIPSFSSSTVTSGDSVDYIIAFNESKVGNYQVVISFFTNSVPDSVLTFNLIGRKDISDFEINPNEIIFPKVYEGFTADSFFTIYNQGSIPLHWTVPINVNNFVVDSIIPLITNVDDSSQVYFHFFDGVADSTYIGEYSFFDTCFNEQVVRFIAVVEKRVYCLIQVGSDSARPGETFKLPIYLRNSENLTYSGITNLNADISFNASILSPLDDFIKNINDGTRTITLELPIIPIRDSTIAEIDFIAGLGNSDRTKITIDNIEIIGGELILDTINGTFQLLGICKEGGSRLINTEVGKLNLIVKTLYSDNDNLELEIELIESGNSELIILNTQGKVVSRTKNISKSPGKYIKYLNISKLASGLYFILLKTQGFVIHKVFFKY